MKKKIEVTLFYFIKVKEIRVNQQVQLHEKFLSAWTSWTSGVKPHIPYNLLIKKQKTHGCWLTQIRYFRYLFRLRDVLSQDWGWEDHWCPLPKLQDLYTSRVRKRAKKITLDPTHPAHLLFELLAALQSTDHQNSQPQEQFFFNNSTIKNSHNIHCLQ